MVSTTSTADIITDPSPKTTDSSADIVESTKTVNSYHFLWMVNHFSTRAMHENEQDLQQQEIITSILLPHEKTKKKWHIHKISCPSDIISEAILPCVINWQESLLRCSWQESPHAPS